MFMGATKTRVVVTAAIAAMWLTACGGGGGGDAPAPAPAPAPAAGGGANPPSTPAAPLGTSFTAAGLSDVWHSLSTSDDGQVMVAGQAGQGSVEGAASFLSVSRDGGVNWSDVATINGLPGANAVWIASDVSGDGNRIAAVQFGGSLVVSVDRGATFNAVALPTSLTGGQMFESVTLSRDGTRIAAAILQGPIIVGTVDAAGAVNWDATPTGLPATAGWRSIDSSADGQTMVAVGQDPVAFISTNGGALWTPLAVNVGGTPVTNQNWYRVKLSADGSTIAMAANAFGAIPGSPPAADGIYVSKNTGATFTRTGIVGDYSGISMSADGGVIVATVSNDNNAAGLGSVQMSRDGGTTFAPLQVTVGGSAVAETDWRAVALNSDATRMGLAAGRFSGPNGGSKGDLYLTTGSRP